MKTIKDWLNTIADKEIRERALRNCTSYDFTPVDSLAEAIIGGFVWSSTPEGNDYWSNITTEANLGNIRLITPKIMQIEDWNDIANGRNTDSDYEVWASPDKPWK